MSIKLIKLVKMIMFAAGMLMAYKPLSVAEEVTPFHLVIGASTLGLRDQKLEDIKLGFETTLNQILAKDHIHSTFIFYKNSQDLAEAIARHEVNAMFGSPAEYLQSENELSVYSLGSGTFGNRDKSGFVVMVRKDSGIENLAQLKGKTLSSPKWVYNDMGKVYLENVLADKNLPAADSFFSRVDTTNFANQSISKLFFKQVDAILMRDLEIDIADELNPQIKQNFKAIAKSEPYIIFVAATLNTVDQANQNALTKNLFNMHKTVKGKSILNLLRISQLHKVSSSDLDSVRRLLNAKNVSREGK